MDAKRPGRIITFYSYKGGTGRSMALANVAWILAAAGKRVLMIDWDLEAPGLHRYFRPFLIDHELSSSEGLIDLVDKYANQAIRPVEPGETTDPQWYLEYADFTDYVLSVTFDHFPPGAKLDLLPAGRQGESYALNVNSFNWQNFYDRLGGGGFFEAVKDRARAEYDYVLIDSRTGVSDTSGICSVQMPDTLVVCFTYNNQSVKGALAVARSAEKMRRKLDLERQAIKQAAPAPSGAAIEDSPLPYRVFAVPMRVDSGESDRLTIRQAYARDAFADLVAHVGREIGQYWNRVEVPHTVFYSYEEVLAPFKDDAADSRTVLAAFVRLASFVTDGVVADYRLPLAPEVRQQYLDLFAETPLSAKAKETLAASRKESEEQTIVRLAETAMASLNDEEKVTARRVIGRLVRLGRDEEGGGYFPIRAALSEYTDTERAVVAKLTSRSLLTVSTDVRQGPPMSKTGAVEQTVALADDRLLKVWKPLLDWLDADREFLLWRQQLRTYLTDWEKTHREPSALLSGRLRSEAEYFSNRRRDDLNAAEHVYVEASLARAHPQTSIPVTVTAPAPLASRFSRWVGIGIAAVLIIGLVWAVVRLWRSQSANRTDVVVAAATAAADPLLRALLLLELGPSAEPPKNAIDLVVELSTTSIPYAVFPGSGNPVPVARFSADGQSFVVGDFDGTVRIWSPGSFQTPRSVTTQVGTVVSAVVDGNRLLVTGRNHIAEIRPDIDAPTRVTTVKLASDLLDGTLAGGSAFVVGGAGRKGLVLERYSFDVRGKPAEGKPLFELPLQTFQLKFSGDGRRVAAFDPDSVRVSDLATGQVSVIPDRVRSIVISPNGAYVGTFTDEALAIWPIASSVVRSRVVPLSGGGGSPRLTSRQTPVQAQPEMGRALSSDGEWVAIAYEDGSVRVWPVSSPGISLQSNSLTSSQEPGAADPLRLRGHRGLVLDLSFSPDGSYLASASGDGTARIWRNPARRGRTERISASTPWADAWMELRQRTTACLTVDERTRLLSEPEAAAKASAAECEGKWGLKSLQAPAAAK